MHIINLTPLEPGVYNDHCSDNITAPPDGWAYIPDDFKLPSTFPRLGSIEAENKTYTHEVEVEKEVTKIREVPSIDENGTPVTVTEEYTEKERVMEEQEYTMMTVTSMTEGTLPEPVEPYSTPTMEERITELENQVAQADETAITLYEAQEEQEFINAQQDEALMELYEMIG